MTMAGSQTPESIAPRKLRDDLAEHEDLPDEEPGLEILPILNFLLRNRGRILKPTLLLVLVVGLYTLTLPPQFTATAKFVSSGNTTSSAIQSKVGSALDLAASILDTLPEYYEALVHSETFLIAVLQKEAQKERESRQPGWLAQLAGTREPDEDRLQSLAAGLKAATTITNIKAATGRVPIIVLTVVANSRELATQIATALLNALSEHNGGQRIEKAVMDRDFIKQRLDEFQAALQTAEEALTQFTAHNRKITTPELVTERARLQRELTTNEEIVLSLRRQYEVVKFRVQENQTILQTIQQPVTLKTGPRYLRYLLLSAVLGFLFFSGLVYLRERWAHLNAKDAQVRELLDNVQDMLRDCSSVLPIGLGDTPGDGAKPGMAPSSSRFPARLVTALSNGAKSLLARFKGAP